MLASQAYTFARRVRLAFSLAWVGGFVDAVGFLMLSAFIGNMTGNSALLGPRLLEGDLPNALFCASLVFWFFIGAVSAGAVIEICRVKQVERVYAPALGAVVILLLATVWYLASGGQSPYWTGALPCLAMGLQNATVTRMSAGVVRTTHVTGMVTDLGLDLGQLLHHLIEPKHWRRPLAGMSNLSRGVRGNLHHPSAQRMFLLGGTWFTFVLGAGLGALAEKQFGFWALLIPAGFIAAFMVVELIIPRSHISPFEPAGRDELLAAFGLKPGDVPDTVGIYHLSGTAEQKELVTPHSLELPDLTGLSRFLRPNEKTVILVIGHAIRMDDNAAEHLGEAARQVARQNRTMIVCLDDDFTHRLLASHPAAVQAIGVANICIDPEFAVARAVELAEVPTT